MILIAGPCSAESEKQLMDTALALRGRVRMLRAGVWKPRTRPGEFEGNGAVALEWLSRVQESTGLPVCTEVASPRHVELCLAAGIRHLWIGARTTSNPFLTAEIASSLRGSGASVMVKNPLSPDLELWIGAMERLSREGVTDLTAVHRGFYSADEKKYRNSPQWRIPIELRSRCPEIPLLTDPSHIAGDTRYVREISQRALDLGFDGLMVEAHPDPASACTDARQQLQLPDFLSMLEQLQERDSSDMDSGLMEKIEQLRAEIDDCDSQIIKSVAARQQISRKIGQLKKEGRMAILQTSRWDRVMEKVREEAVSYGLDPTVAELVFSALHDASIREQD